jgi:hypothetical protein
MFAKHPKLIMIMCVLLGLSLGLFVGISIKTPQLRNNANTQRAIRSVIININPSRQDKLFTQLREFADKWNYAILIDPISPNGEDFRIGMWREDTKLIGLYPTDPGTLYIGFYYTNPAVLVPERYFDEEISDLEKFISEIPNATLSVEK